MFTKKMTSIFIGLTGLLLSITCVAKVITTEPIICKNNVEELQKNAKTAYLVELSDVQYGGEPSSLSSIGPNGILYSPAQITILKIYRDPMGTLAALGNTSQEAILSRSCDSIYNEKNGSCWALQMIFENGQRWVLFDTYMENDRIDFSLRDCPEASFLVEDDAQLKAWEEKYVPAP